MFFKKDKDKNQTYDFTYIAALFIHAAKIDQNYSDQEEKIIKEALLKIGTKKENLEEILKQAKKIEEDSVQILDFTRKVKDMSEKKKIEIIEILWRIIYSNKDADIYETNLMRRLAGLLYIDNKIMGDIKEKIKKENSK